MRVLGIIGRLNCKECHDAAAAIVEDGVVIAAIEQERLSRRKHAPGEAPLEAISACLKQARLSFSEIDHFAYGWIEDLENPLGHLGEDIVISKELSTLIFPPEVFDYEQVQVVHFVRHHLAHMAASYFTSGFKDSAGLILDGQGEAESISLYYARGKEIRLLETYGLPFSLGLFYETAAFYAGLGWDAAGKLMGLSSYGRPRYKIDFHFDQDRGHFILPQFIREHLTKYDKLKLTSETICQLWTDYFESALYPYSISSSSDDFAYYCDFAASIQRTLQQIVCSLVRYLKSKTNSKNLVMGGGVALNCAMNSSIMSMSCFDDMFIFPAANDAGSSVGAALAVYHRLVDRDNLSPQQKTADLGSEFSDSYIKAVLLNSEFRAERLNWGKLIERVSTDLVNNKIVAWFQGRDEIGPRALGKRSFLANPTVRSNQNRMNKLKGREMWRPLSPSILSEFADDVLDHPRNPNLERFMLGVCRVYESWRPRIPVVVHCDDTTRPHIVYRHDDELYWELIEAFRKKTGIPLVCNTSLNVSGEPMVHTPQVLLAIFSSRQEIDTVTIGNFYITRS